MIWLWFILVQLIQIVASIIGWFVLVPFCLAKAWVVSGTSIKDGRAIDRWKFSALNTIYGNPEDGVSGIQAVVWPNGIPGPYMAGANPAWRSYCWSALRNSCDNLKYVFSYKKGPLKNIQIGPLVVKMGWQPENGYNVPVLSGRKSTS